MKIFIIPITAAILLSSYSCTKEDIEPSNKGLLKYKYWYYTFLDTIPMGTYEYLYDNQNRLKRINQFGFNTTDTIEYESFYYNPDKLLKTKLNYSYASNLTGWILHDSCNYEYENDLLVLEEHYYPFPNDYYVSYRYEYENSRLIRKNSYINEEFDNSVVYEYNKNFCIKETLYNDYELTSIYSFVQYFYYEGQLVKSLWYRYPDIIMKEVNYAYNYAGKLITEESTQLDYEVSVLLAYFYYYEYY